MRRISEVLWCCLSMVCLTNPENGSRKTVQIFGHKKKEREKKKYEEARYFSLIKGGICSAKAFGYR